MNGSQGTAAMLGVGGSAIDLLDWACTAGQHFPLPDDTKIAMVVVGGYVVHLLSEVFAKYFPQAPNAQ
jgi:hypothetical protein